MIAQVLAAPVVVVTNISPVPVNPRLGHGVPPKAGYMGRMKKGPCGRHRFRQKAVEISNLFREALGLPLITSSSHHGHDDGKVRILPFIGTPNILAPVHGKDTEGAVEVVNMDAPHDGHRDHGNHPHGRHRHHHKGHHHLGKGTFINRIQYSIMNLGRWEGRAVAFVLGKISKFSYYNFHAYVLIRLRNWSSSQDGLRPGRCHVPHCEGTTL